MNAAERAAYPPSPMSTDESEWKTRKRRIDPKLDSAGWRLLKKGSPRTRPRSALRRPSIAPISPLIAPSGRFDRDSSHFDCPAAHFDRPLAGSKCETSTFKCDFSILRPRKTGAHGGCPPTSPLMGGKPVASRVFPQQTWHRPRDKKYPAVRTDGRGARQRARMGPTPRTLRTVGSVGPSSPRRQARPGDGAVRRRVPHPMPPPEHETRYFVSPLLFLRGVASTSARGSMALASLPSFFARTLATP